MKPIIFSFALSTALLLTACGGSTGDKDALTTPSSSQANISSSSGNSVSKTNSSATSTSTSANSSTDTSATSSLRSSTAAGFSLGGSVTGLEGSLKLQAGTQSVTVSADGDFTFPNRLASGTRISLVVSEAPFRQACTLNKRTPFNVRADVSDIAVTCGPQGILTGTVNNYHTGTPISQAKVTVTALDGDGNTLMTDETQTDSNGAYSLEGLGLSSRFLLNVQREGFVTRTEILANFEDQPDISRSPLMLPINELTSFSASSAASLTVNGNVIVELPANALVTAAGTPATGPITPTITVIDPSGDPSVMPGNYEVRNAETGAISYIQSFGAVDIKFHDAEGNPLQLATDVTATISIPVAIGVDLATAAATTPLFYFNEATGYWVEEGTATLVNESGRSFYRGTVTHFTTWNADRVYATVNVRGCVRNADDYPLAYVRVISSGRDYIGQTTTYSNINGEFSIPVRQSSAVLLTSISETQSDTVAVDSGTSDITRSDCLKITEGSAIVTLTWGKDPKDLDSHLFIPDPVTNVEYELYYSNKTVEVNGVVFDLDVDDVTSFGPEVVTVPDFPHAGTYRYVVKLYAGTSTIAASPARVSLNLRGTTYVFTPDAATGDSTARHWHVFNIVVDDALNPTVQTVQQFSADPSSVVAGPVARIQRGFKPQGRHTSEQEETAIETKYYAE
jgi:hypothetical protein